MHDVITKIGNSTIQHGKNNDRIYLIKLYQNDFPDILDQLDQLAAKNQYSKIFAKVPARKKQIFEDNEYITEATIPHFFNGNEDVIFMSKYFSPERKKLKNENLISNVLKASFNKAKSHKIKPINPNFHCKETSEENTKEMVSLYKKVFQTYPFPIFEPEYIVNTMHQNIKYFGIWHNNKLVALASSEMDESMKNVEMTDFATLPQYTGNHLAVHLLEKMEQEMKRLGIKTAYTIARSVSYGMNITFSKMGYTFSGTLINNTQISGKLESMNVWYKELTE